MTVGIGEKTMTDKIYTASWLMPCFEEKTSATEFYRSFHTHGKIRSATLCISALGVYEARLNGERLSWPLAPGWTPYQHRVQYQKYDVTSRLREGNMLSVTVAQGWRMPYGFRGVTPVKTWTTSEIAGDQYALIASLHIVYADGSEELLLTDESWRAKETKYRSCNLYQGDVYDETFEEKVHDVRIIDHPKKILAPQEGEIIAEHETFKPVSVIRTPKGETVLDFGQNLTGYLSFSLTVPAGKTVVIDHAEVLDRDGNFYNENYRSAKARIEYTGDGEPHEWKPSFTFYGFRYVRLTEMPCAWSPDDFTAVVLHSDIERTGYFECSDERLNQLYHNIIWGQKGNFLDVPTDCPQRDERLGWTGDAQVFARCAAYNYNVNKFFRKWLTDMSLEQLRDGRIVQIIPRLDWVSPACGWSDACIIIPWQMYLLYGDRELLARQYVTIKRWIDYMYDQGDYYINSPKHFGDWLAMDAPDPKSCKGGTDIRFIAYAYRAHATELFIRISRVVGIGKTSIADYEEKLRMTKRSIHTQFFSNGMVMIPTQTAHVLALRFGLCESAHEQAHADRLAQMIRANGDRLTTGFLGTPYLLHVLTAYGYTDLAYTLLFQTKNPSWLYSVEHGATTMWEHWDGIREDGSMCGSDMNSYNHYAYGAVGDWLYGTVAGIETDEQKPGFENIRFVPKTTERLTFAKGSVKTKYGTVSSEWYREGDTVRYVFTVPSGTTATAEIEDGIHILGAGTHSFTVKK
jgi:alpha-L-rhamnosidase